jgi:chemotaxis protein histidine kinase CheA
MGGSISVSSEIDAGTEFVIVLPTIDAPPLPPDP